MAVELFEQEAPTLLTLAGLPPGHSLSLDDLLAMFGDSAYETSESQYVMMVSGECRRSMLLCPCYVIRLQL